MKEMLAMCSVTQVVVGGWVQQCADPVEHGARSWTGYWVGSYCWLVEGVPTNWELCFFLLAATQLIDFD